MTGKKSVNFDPKTMIPRQTSQAGIDLIKKFEGCSLVAYRDSAGILTIGYGSTSNVVAGESISQQEADIRLERDLGWAQACVDRKVGPNLTQNQFDALVSLVFNLGCPAFSGSRLLRLLNAGEIFAAAQEFPKWDHAGGQVLAGLTARRVAERQLFLTA